MVISPRSSGSEVVHQPRVSSLLIFVFTGSRTALGVSGYRRQSHMVLSATE